MKRIQIYINSVPYTVVCDEKDIQKVKRLSQEFNNYVIRVSKTSHKGNQAHLFLVTALIILEELEALKKDSVFLDYEKRIKVLCQKVKKLAEMSI